jgi:hypothetical protein
MTPEITPERWERGRWKERFEEGFDHGQQEQLRSPQRANVQNRIEDERDDLFDREVEAMQAGYDVGLTADWETEIDIERRATESFEHSEYYAARFGGRDDVALST